MTPLRRRMIEDMRLRNFSPCTEKSYLHYVTDFAFHHDTSPEYLGLDDIRNYQLYLIEKRQLSPSSINTFVSAVQFLYTVTLEMPWGDNRFVRMKVPEKLPAVLSQAEVTALFHHVGILKHRAVLMLCYGSGLRISEAVSLKAEHIDSDRMLIHVEKGKGAKDRYTVISKTLLKLLRQYWKIQQPQDYILLHHPHLHCVVPGGGLSPDGERWISCKPGFFLHVKVLSHLFRRLFLEQLRAAFGKGKLRFFGDLTELHDPDRFADYLEPLEDADWVVYAKPTFGGPRQALDYLSRYTHRVALTNERLLDVKDGQVTFQWKDYRSKGRQKSRVMTLESDEFIRRFLIHVLPRGFQRIRFFGLLANRRRKETLTTCRRLLTGPMADLLPNPDEYRTLRQPIDKESIRRCPCCDKGEMVRILTLAPATQPPDSS